MNRYFIRVAKQEKPGIDKLDLQLVRQTEDNKYIDIATIHDYKELEQYIDLRGKTKVEDRRGNLQDDKDN